MPPDIAERIDSRLWAEDWRIMSLPGRLARYLLRPRGDLSWMKALPRMESHILDGPHFLLETHPAECAALMSALVRRVK